MVYNGRKHDDSGNRKLGDIRMNVRLHKAGVICWDTKTESRFFIDSFFRLYVSYPYAIETGNWMILE